ncbi:DUF551 domain-containing protein [Pantoea sp. GbtcB22]|uniref:DUF551 domain-containing protein n=1 Tax=Pantoea sp. GbtcB22 TaxID=2824767 RepID=UPI001C2F35D1|nr:DUF551 domain-containing protein [Pantoea sp. GbtcB22]
MMTEEQQRVADWCAEELARYENHNPATDLDQILIKTMRIALATLTQPASPDFKLPDGWVAVPREATIEMIESGWTYSVLEKNATAKGTWACMVAAAPAVPHTAPIEPICATGGAEWVKLEDELPKDGSWCIAIEEGDFAGDVVYWGNGEWRSEFGRDEYTHWMYHPAAPEEE